MASPPTNYNPQPVPVNNQAAMQNANNANANKESTSKKLFGWVNATIGVWISLLIICALIAWFYVGIGICSVADCSATVSFNASYD